MRDEPEDDFREMEIDSHGMWSIKLPIQKPLWCGCVVDLEWVFMNGNQFAECCVAIGAGPRDWDHHKPHYLGDKPNELAKNLFERYQQHIAKIKQIS